MASSSAFTYNISDFLEWDANDQLKLDPDFQRGAVWTAAAQTFLIDTILRGYPIPQIFIRSKIDVATRMAVREVVDGQQRLRAIFAFANDGMRLSSRSKEFGGKRYTDLSDELKAGFLSYGISTVQLINASNTDVLEIFARLNSYGVKVTPAELRHSTYSEPVKWHIWDATIRWSMLWERYRLVSVREAVRLKNNSVMAELYISADEGLSDGGEPQIGKYYN